MHNLFQIKNLTIFAFSDTHGHHRALQVPEDADIIICAGDAVEDDLRGGEYDDFISWFGSLPAKWKLFVPGNHELSFIRSRYKTIVQQFETAGILDNDLGSPDILNFVLKANPKWHLFGHIHATEGQQFQLGSPISLFHLYHLRWYPLNPKNPNYYQIKSNWFSLFPLYLHISHERSACRVSIS